MLKNNNREDFYLKNNDSRTFIAHTSINYLKPLSEVVTPDGRFGFEDGQWNGPFGDRSALGLLGDDEFTRQA